MMGKLGTALYAATALYAVTTLYALGPPYSFLDLASSSTLRCWMQIRLSGVVGESGAVGGLSVAAGGLSASCR